MRGLKTILHSCTFLALITSATSCMDMMMDQGGGGAADEKLRSSLLAMRGRVDQHHDRVAAAADRAALTSETDSYLHDMHHDMQARMAEMMTACESMMMGKMHCAGGGEPVAQKSDSDALSTFMSAAFREYAARIQAATTADEMKALAREHRRHVHAMLGHMEMMDRMMAMHR